VDSANACNINKIASPASHQATHNASDEKDQQDNKSDDREQREYHGLPILWCVLGLGHQGLDARENPQDYQ